LRGEEAVMELDVFVERKREVNQLKLET